MAGIRTSKRALELRKEPKQARSRETVDVILEAAAQVFERHGYAETTTDQVAERAGVSVGSVYQYFPSKDALLAALVKRFAADAVACRLMGSNASEVPHLQLAANRGYGTVDLKQIDVSPDNWEAWASNFAPPPETLDVQFPNIQILDKQSCSACQSTLLLFLKQYADQLVEYFPGDGPAPVAIGRGHESLPPDTLCIGNCTAAHKNVGTFVPGCPPVGSEILKAISDQQYREQSKESDDSPQT